MGAVAMPTSGCNETAGEPTAKALKLAAEAENEKDDTTVKKTVGEKTKEKKTDKSTTSSDATSTPGVLGALGKLDFLSRAAVTLLFGVVVSWYLLAVTKVW